MLLSLAQRGLAPQERRGIHSAATFDGGPCRAAPTRHRAIAATSFDAHTVRQLRWRGAVGGCGAVVRRTSGSTTLFG